VGINSSTVSIRRAARVAAILLACVTVSSCAPPVLSESSVAGRAITQMACEIPRGAADFASAAPSEVSLDADALRSALSGASMNLASSVRVYRHDCLIATSGNDWRSATAPANLWSGTKTIVSLLVGRAITLGRLHLDDPIGRFLPEYDATHGAITVRQLLTQTSGLRFAWLNDANPALADTVAYVGTLPFDHVPGTYFEYAQAPVTVLAEVVTRAVGMDVQTFAREQLFGPLAIADADWYWARDRSGHTIGYAQLSMRPLDLAKIGSMLLHHGQWGETALIDPDYLREATSSSATNPGYGFLIWTNQGMWHYSASILVRHRVDRRWIASAPADMFALSGLGDQYVFVVPSLDLVVVRTGFFGASPWRHEFFRTLGLGVTDVDVADVGPYTGEPPNEFDIARGVDLASWPR